MRQDNHPSLSNSLSLDLILIKEYCITFCNNIWVIILWGLCSEKHRSRPFYSENHEMFQKRNSVKIGARVCAWSGSAFFYKIWSIELWFGQLQVVKRIILLIICILCVGTWPSVILLLIMLKVTKRNIKNRIGTLNCFRI